MVYAIGAIILAIAALLQVTLAERVTLLQGPADLVLLTLAAWNLQESVEPDWRWGVLAGLMLSLSSVLPFWLVLVSYGAATLLIQLLRRRVWQIPLLTLFTSIVLGTLLIDGISLTYLWFAASPIDFQEAFNIVVIPSVILNMILALPAYALVGEVSKLLLPGEVTP